MAERKYYSYGLRIGTYQKTVKSGWIFKQKETKDIPFLFYQEDNNFYEFFTGRYLGKLTVDQYGSEEVAIPEFALLNIPIKGGTRDEASCVSAAAFAGYVKPLLEDKDLIAEKVNAFFDESHLTWLKRQAEQAVHKLEEKSQADWLNRLLDERK